MEGTWDAVRYFHGAKYLIAAPSPYEGASTTSFGRSIGELPCWRRPSQYLALPPARCLSIWYVAGRLACVILCVLSLDISVCVAVCACASFWIWIRV